MEETGEEGDFDNESKRRNRKRRWRLGLRWGNCR